ncbi:hypothetical protein WISP_67616 [Willisornis vidua]|uniref:Uncharacterized protein n=1 Tax=Willisornis vidua TaxID=1566151 RepID=A0ABQ9DB98_9PASS|nr:hypothetical protein WISP_67616 [Willisornis vidua]
MVAPAALPAAGLLYWVGALGALYAAALASYRLLAGLRVWVLGSGAAAVGPALGAWAAQCTSLPLGRLAVKHPGDSKERPCVQVRSTEVSPAKKSD